MASAEPCACPICTHQLGRSNSSVGLGLSTADPRPTLGRGLHRRDDYGRLVIWCDDTAHDEPADIVVSRLPISFTTTWSAPRNRWCRNSCGTNLASGCIALVTGAGAWSQQDPISGSISNRTTGLALSRWPTPMPTRRNGPRWARPTHLTSSPLGGDDVQDEPIPNPLHPRRPRPADWPEDA